MALTKIKTSGIADNAITNAKMADDAIDSADFADASIDNVHVATGLDAVKLADGSVTNAELQYINTLSSNAQTQISAKLPLSGGAMTGAITTNSTFDGVDIATRDGVLTSTTTTANAALPKAGGTMTGNIVMADDTSIGISDSDERIEFDASGDISFLGCNVGIGVTNPGYPLTFPSLGNEGVQLDMGYLQIGASSTGTTNSFIGNPYNNDAGRFDIRMKGAALADAKVTVLGSGNVGIGMTPAKLLDLQATDNLALRYYNGATFKAGVEVATTIGDMISGSAVDDLAIRSNANMLFSTGGNTERMRIDSSGNVGIGKSPTVKFETIGSAGANSIVRFLAPSGSYNSAIELWGDAGEDANDGMKIMAGHAAQGLYFYSSKDSGIGGSTAWDMRMHIGANGNVGIGAESSGSKLEIAGGADAIALVLGTTTAARLDLQTDTYHKFIQILESDGRFRLYNQTTNSEQLTVSSDGKVGIGTSTPAVINSWTAASNINVLNVYDADAGARIVAQGNDASFDLIDLNATADEQWFSIYNNGSTVYFRTLEDDGADVNLELMNFNLNTGTTSLGDPAGNQGATFLSNGTLTITHDGNTNNLVLRNHDVNVDQHNVMQIWDYANDSDGSSSGADRAYYVRMEDSDGEIGSIKVYSASGVAFNTSSDYRLKENEVLITDGLEMVNNLKPYRFNFKGYPELVLDGFFAHEVAPFVPTAVDGEKDAMNEDGTIHPQSMDYGQMATVMVAAIQELSAKVEELENA